MVGCDFLLPSRLQEGRSARDLGAISWSDKLIAI